MIPIYVNPSSGVPVYMQIMNQVRSLIAGGTLKENDRLPSVRELAAFLQVNPMTVSKAYSLMELDKTVYRLHGKGVFISSSPKIIAKGERLRMLEVHIKHMVYEAVRLGVSPEETIEMVRDTLKDLQKEKQGER